MTFRCLLIAQHPNHMSELVVTLGQENGRSGLHCTDSLNPSVRRLEKGYQKGRWPPES